MEWTSALGAVVSLVLTGLLLALSGCGVSVRSDDREYSVDCELTDPAAHGVQNSAIQQLPDD